MTAFYTPAMGRIALWLGLAGIVASTACWGSHSAPPVQPSPPAERAVPAVVTAPAPTTHGIRFVSRTPRRCIRVVAHVFDTSRKDASTTASLSEQLLEDMQQMAVESCEETQWTEEALDCYESATSSPEMTRCYRAMTQAQQDDFAKRLTELMQKHTSGGNVPPPTP